ncbi:MAG: glycosyltransferase [Gelidibacter sp.]
MSNSKIKILFVLPTLKAGGAERVISFVASNLNRQKFESILVVMGKAEDAVYSTEGIEVHFLNKSRVIKAVPLLLKYFIAIRPHIVVGSISHVNRVLAMASFLFPRIKFVGREASVSSIMKLYPSTSRRFKLPILKNYYHRMSAIVCQSSDMADDLVAEFNVPKQKMHLISNPISGNLPLKTVNSNPNRPKRLITIGRLSKEKGHDRILKALSKAGFDYRYTIIGTGTEMDALFQLAKELHIFDKIDYIPHTDDVATYLAQSDVFIQGSYVEGFPNALLESCVVGTPVLAFPSPGGTKEIIEEDINGFIVDNDTDFIEKLNYILHQKKWDPQQVSLSVTNKYNKELILKKYETLFKNLSSKQRSK